MGMWSDNLLIGVPEIDNQHKKLVHAIEELTDACFKGQGKDKIENTLNFVYDYTRVHFSDEERLHVKNGYPDGAAHKQLHNKFISTIEQVKNDFKIEGPSTGLSIKLNKMLANWLIAHITFEDKKYANYIQSKNI